jgi:tetratricopeptide (TPR) repeat protein
MGWKGDIAMASGDYDSAQAIFSSKLEFARLATGNIQDRPADSWTELEKSRLYTFANAMFDLGKFQGKALDPATFAILKVAFDLFEKLDAHESAASCAFHLGHAYMDIGKQRDLTEADSWYCKSIELGDKTNPLKYAGRLHERGQVRYVQMVQLLQTKEPDIAEVEKLANSAAAFAREALAILPEDAMQERMLLYHLLGNLYDDTGHVKEALVNYQEAVRCTEDRSAFGEGAMFCREIARCLRKAGRLDEALLYARESLQKLTNLGPGAKDDILRSNQLIQAIEQDLRAASNQIKST